MPLDIQPKQPVLTEEQAALKRSDDALAMWRSVADQIRKANQAPLLETMKAAKGMPAGQEAQQEWEKWQKFGVADVLAAVQHIANNDQNKELYDQAGRLYEYHQQREKKEYSRAMKDAFEASRGSASGIATDVLNVPYQFGKTMADVGSFGISRLVTKGARKAVEAMGGPTAEKSEESERLLTNEAERTGLGSTLGGAARIAGFLRGFGGATGAGAEKAFSGPMGLVSKGVESGLTQGGIREAAARLAGSGAGGFMSAELLNSGGQAAADAINYALYGSEQDKQSAIETLKALPHSLVNAGISGVFMPMFQRIGRGITANLAGRWAPGVRLGDSLSKFGTKEMLATRAAQGVGGAFEFLGLTALPGVSEDGISIAKPWIELFKNGDPKALMEQMIVGAAMGAAKSHYEGGYSSLGPSHGILVRQKPKLPPDVEATLRKTTREAVDSMMKEAGGSEQMMATMLNAVRLREQLGYEKPGAYEALANLADHDLIEQAKKKNEEKISYVEEKEARERDKALPADEGYLSPGMTVTNKDEASALGLLPFMSSDTAKQKAPAKVGVWPSWIRPDFVDSGTRVQIKLNGEWVDGVVEGPRFLEQKEKRGNIKGVVVKTAHGDALVTGASIQNDLVRMASDNDAKVSELRAAAADARSRQPMTETDFALAKELERKADALDSQSQREPLRDPRLLPDQGPREEPRLRKFGEPRTPDAHGQRPLPFRPVTDKEAARRIVEAQRRASLQPSPGSTEPSGRAPETLSAEPTVIGVRPRDRGLPEPSAADQREVMTDQAREIALSPTPGSVAPWVRAPETLADTPVSVGESILPPAKAAAEKKAETPEAGAERALAENKSNISILKTRGKKNKQTAKKIRALSIEADKAKSQRDEAQRAARTDSLTGLGNDVAWKESIQRLPGSGDVVAVVDGTNISSANKQEVGGHDNGDKVIAAMGARLREARQASDADVSLFRKGNKADEFAVRGKPAEVKKFLAELRKNTKVGESVIGGVKHEHRLIAGDANEIPSKAEESQQNEHALYKVQAEEAGLGLSKAITPDEYKRAGKKPPGEEPPKQEAKKEPKPPAPAPAPAPAPVAEEKPSDAKSRAVPGLKRVKLVPPLKGTQVNILKGFSAKKKEEPKPEEKPTRVSAAVEEGPPSPEPAAKPTPTPSASPSLTPEKPPVTEKPTRKYTPKFEKMGANAFVEWAESPDTPFAELKSARNELETSLLEAEKDSTPEGDANADRISEILDRVDRALVNQVNAKKAAVQKNLARAPAIKAPEAPKTEAPKEEPKPAPAPAPATAKAEEPARVATMPGLTTPTEIVQRAVTFLKNKIAVSSAVDNYVGHGREGAAKFLNERLSDMEKLLEVVKKKSEDKSFSSNPLVVSTSAPPSVELPQSGDYVLIRMDNGRSHHGVVIDNNKIKLKDVAEGKEPGTGRRLIILKDDGTVERVRISDVSDISPGDVLTHQFGTDPLSSTEVSLGTFSSWFAGRDAMATPGYEETGPGKNDFSEDARAKGAERREKIISRTGTEEDAQREAIARGRRMRVRGRWTSDDFAIEALAYLARPEDRRYHLTDLMPDVGAKEVQASLSEKSKKVDPSNLGIAELQEIALDPTRVRERKGRDIAPDDSAEQKRKDLLDEAGYLKKHGEQPMTKQTVVYFDPKAELRKPSELKELALTDENAAKDYAEYDRLSAESDVRRMQEEKQDALDKQTETLGRGFRVVGGEIEDLQTPNKPIYVAQLQWKGDQHGSNILEARSTKEGKVLIRQLTTSQILTLIHDNPGIHDAVKGMNEYRKARVDGRTTVQERVAKAKAIQAIVVKAQNDILDYWSGKTQDLPAIKSRVYDAAMRWLRDHPRPPEGTAKYDDWVELANEQFARSPKGESGFGRSIVDKAVAASEKAPEPDQGKTLLDLMAEHGESLRNPITGMPLVYDKATGKVSDYSPTPGSSTTLFQSALPGAPSAGMWNATKQFARIAGGVYHNLNKFVYDITKSTTDAVIHEVQAMTFRPDYLNLQGTRLGESALWRRWVQLARTAEAKIMPGGDEHLGYMLNEVNRAEGEESVAMEKMEFALRDLRALPYREQLEILRQYDAGKKPAILDGYRKFMNEMLDASQEFGWLPKGEKGDRFRDSYIHMGMYRVDIDKMVEARDEVRKQLSRAMRAGDELKTRQYSDRLEQIEELLKQTAGRVGPKRKIISPFPLSKLTDPASAALEKSGALRHRTFENLDDAIKNGLDVSSPIDLLKNGMMLEMQAVNRHRLFTRLASDSRFVMNEKDAPSWYVKVDPGRTSKHNSWRILDGKAVNPALLDQLYQLDARRNVVQRIMDYLHSSLKMTRAMTEPSAIISNLVGNPAILVSNGMSLPAAHGEYMRAFMQLSLADPALEPIWRTFGFGKAVELAKKSKYGAQREKYMREGWITHASDLTRELQTELSDNRALRDVLNDGFYQSKNLTADDGIASRFYDVMARLVEKGGEKMVRFYNLIDASARAALHEHLTSNGMGFNESAAEVNKSFDVNHLPTVMRALRRGLGGVGADSFLSFKVAMARNLSKVIAASPMVYANYRALAWIVRKITQKVMGLDDEEAERIIDGSLPVTGSDTMDTINRQTALILPQGDGQVGVRSMVKYTPHDAILDLVPGVRAAVMGGTDDRGRKPEDFLRDWLSRSVVSAPYFSYYLDQDQNGLPVRDRYKSMSEYLRHETGLLATDWIPGAPDLPIPFLLPGRLKGAGAALSTIKRKANLFEKTKGGVDPQYQSIVPTLKTGERDTVPGATAQQTTTADAIWSALGMPLTHPNQIRRAMEYARARDTRVGDNDGRFRPNILQGEAGRKDAKDASSELNRIKDVDKGLRVWRAIIDLQSAIAEKMDDSVIESYKKKINSLANTNQEFKSIRMALLAVNESAKAADIIRIGRQLGVYVEQETPRTSKFRGGRIPSR